LFDTQQQSVAAAQSLLPRLFFSRWKPALVFNQATQVFDLAGVTGITVDDAGKPNT
jgi:hypothetical protein